MTSQAKRVFKQKILKELATFQTQYQYFQHTKLMAKLLRKRRGARVLSNYDFHLMLAAVYGYHWGCQNLFGKHHCHPDLP
ncbi:MAG TPA: hypothetical protein PLM16_02180, partial [Candidatus Woesebacteria bacterium]|nr:hypothetical protein [Candidatus Woesebacteria bacterium]